MKAYTTKSNALRAAKSAGFTKEQVEIVEYEGGYTWIEVVAAPAAVEAKPVASIPVEVEKPAKVATTHEIKNESTTALPCKSVWAIADEMKGARRKDVIAACVEKGIAYNTARTQYQQWYQINSRAK